MAIINGTAVANLLNGTAAGDTINGLGGNDTLNGLGGDDTLDGGTGNDAMAGGLGNDTYVVDAAGDVVTEAVSAGTDTVQSSISYSIAALANVERITLTGTGNTNATGNAGNNVLTGNAGNNVLNGGLGNDTMVGGAGNDTYLVSAAGDVVTEGAAAGTDTVQSSISYSIAALANVERITLTSTGNINATGNAGNNVLTGNAGNNVLNGGLGNDTMVGGAGNDTYLVSAAGDVVTEGAAAGTDTVQSSISYSIAALANVERITLTSTGNINATGNAGNNVLTGNAGNNILSGGGGNDAMAGGLGNDTYVVDAAGDVVTEAVSAGTDTVQSSISYSIAALANVERITLTGTGNTNATGNAGNNVLTGNAGNNVLNGGLGNDTMVGGAGNDTYLVSAAGDVVTEGAAAGTDTVQSSISYSIAALANVENVTLTSTGNINATGNAGNNVLTGNAGNNVLNGGLGNDTMVGGLGNDTYVVDAAGDVVTEGAAAGTDTVQSSISYSIAALANVENVTLTGTGNINATGNAGNNVLTGNAGNNVLNGGLGNDAMAGGLGNDTYVVDAAGDVVTEAVSAGTDTVQSSISYSIAALANVENVTLTSMGNINATGNTGNNVLAGNSGNNILSGGAGNDTLNGVGGEDSLNGGEGDDVLVWDGSDAIVDGGAGTDALQVNGSGALNLTAVADGKITDVEIVNLAGTNTLTLAASDVLAISAADTLRVDGGAGDVVNAGVDWTQIGNVTIGSQEYAQYVKDGATLQVDLDVDRSGIAVAKMNLDVLDGATGFRLDGVGGVNASLSVASAGDVNGDGHADVIIGASGAGDAAGQSYVVFGGTSAYLNGLHGAGGFDLSALNGTNGFRLDGDNIADESGHSVSAAGDVNGDGWGDVIVGAHMAGGGAGASYVVFGKASGFSASLELGSLDGSNGFRLDGTGTSSSGISVAAAGDVNGDGIADLVVGADNQGSGKGATYVVFGTTAGFDATLDLSTLDGSNGFRLDGVNNNDRSGFSVASAGDVNADGYTDIIVGARQAEPAAGGTDNRGESYVVFGHAGGFGATLDLSTLDGSNGILLNGVVAADQSGTSVAAAGDVNGDGYGDVIVGAPRADGFVGESYVVFGGDAAYLDTLHGASGFDLSTLNGSNGFRIDGVDADGFLGISVAAAGDVNGDGYDDVIVGSDFESGIADSAYVVFGGGSGFDASLSLSDLDGLNGFRLDGVAASFAPGHSVAGAGDVNGDGFADLIVGAPDADGAAGAGFVVFGRDFTSAVDRMGGTGEDALAGTAAAENFVGGLGNDTMTGNGGADVFRGGAGNDGIIVGDLAFRDVDGGAGRDTLSIAASNVTLNLGGTAGARISGIEVIDLAGSNVSLVLGAEDLSRLSEGSTLRVMGGADDVIEGGDGWDFQTLFTDGGQEYARYTQGELTLEVDNDIDHGLGSLMRLATLDGSSGSTIFGAGGAVNGAGDVNGDGFDEIIISVTHQFTDGGGQLTWHQGGWVVFGSEEGYGDGFSLGSLGGTNGFAIPGSPWVIGEGLSQGGDVNGDGFSDVQIGGPENGSHTGEWTLVYGRETFGPTASYDSLLNIADPGNYIHAFNGGGVLAMGDLNGDGYADPIVGSDVEIHRILLGSPALVSLNGASEGLVPSRTVRFVAPNDADQDPHFATGDLNADGYDDFIFGDPGPDDGRVFVMWGQPAFDTRNPVAYQTVSGSVELTDPDPEVWIELEGVSGSFGSGSFGADVSSGGDFNGDGIDDLVIGDSGTRGAYVLFGTTTPFDFNTSIADYMDGTKGVFIGGLDDTSVSNIAGESVSFAGDVNGDGYDDVLVGVAGSNLRPSTTYVVFGSASGFGSTIDLDGLDGSNGFSLQGVQNNDIVGAFGETLGAAGDVNGDGYDDIILGSPVHTVDQSYVIYGRDFSGKVDFAGGTGNDTFAGTAAAEIFIGGLGNDTLTGGGGADVFRGGAGDDRIVAGDLSFLDVDGGNGTDTLVVGQSLDLTAPGNAKITGIEAIDLVAGSGPATLTLAMRDAAALSDTSNTVRVLGGAGDAVVALDEAALGHWARGANVVLGDGQTYAVYNLGGVTLQVDVDVDRSGIDVQSPVVTLSTPSPALASYVFGSNAGENAGTSAAAAGDVNGDGFADLIIGAPHNSVDGVGSNVGKGYVVFGSAMGFGPAVHLGSLDGTTGVTLKGVATGDEAGISVASAGDVNGDGRADVILGAHGVGSNEGASYLVFGGTGGYLDTLHGVGGFNLSTLDGTNGLRLDGIDAGDFSGHMVASAGDVNGDGYGDFVIGAHPANGGVGESYVVFGHGGSFDASLDLGTLDGENGIQLNGAGAGANAGRSVASAGDVNGDGYGDLIVGAPGIGESYVVFGGSAAALDALNGAGGFDLSTLDGANGIRLAGAAADTAGISVASAGDVNGDGYGDLIVGAPGADGAGTDRGASYIVFGGSNGYLDALHGASGLDLSTLDGSNGLILKGIADGDQSGNSVSAAGDFNGDGYDDVIVAAAASNPDLDTGVDQGASYVVFGGSGGYLDALQGASGFDLSALDGANGLRLDGASQRAPIGAVVAAAGDVNGDGFADLLVTAPNGDSLTTASNQGTTFVIYGHDVGGVVDFMGTAGADTLAGTAAAEVIVGAAGNDTLTGGGGADVIRSGAGNDRIAVAGANFLDVDGGGGADTLSVVGPALALDLTAIGSGKITGIETINLVASGGANTLTLSLADVLALSDETNTLTVDGAAADSVTVEDGTWIQSVDGGYTVYTSTSSAAVLRIATAIVETVPM